MSKSDVAVFQHIINGVSTEPESGEYGDVINPADGSVVARAAMGNTTDVQQTITITPFSFTAQPSDQNIIVGSNGSFSVTTSGPDTFQWEVSTDGGSNFNPIADGAEYTGTQTANLTVTSPDMDKNGYIYRVVASNAAASCSAITSNNATLSIRLGTVITNRRITYRVNRN